MTRVVIVGGGLSGLSTAYYLAESGIQSTLLESSGRLGGLIRTDFVEGCQLEAGPDSFIATKPAAIELATELGLGNSIISSNDAVRRIGIVRRGRLVPLPKGMVMMAPAEWKPALLSRLFGLRTKARLVSEMYSRPRQRSADFAVRDLVLDHFGKEMLEYVAEPLLSGVYGGNAATLSATSVLPRFVAYEQKLGSLIRGVRRERRNQERDGSLFQSFAGGMQQLTDALARTISGHCEVRQVKALNVRRESSSWIIESTAGHNTATHVVIACPAHVAANLVRNTVPELAAETGAIPYSSAILISLLFEADRARNKLDGFGFLVPPSERDTVASATFIHNKFPSRVRAGLAAVRAFIVDPQAAKLEEADEGEILALVHRDLAHLLKLQAKPILSTVYRWPFSMPQYVTGHAARRARIEALLERNPGLHVASNWLSGVGVPDCVRVAKETAKRIVDAQSV